MTPMQVQQMAYAQQLRAQQGAMQQNLQPYNQGSVPQYQPQISAQYQQQQNYQTTVPSQALSMQQQNRYTPTQFLQLQQQALMQRQAQMQQQAQLQRQAQAARNGMSYVFNAAGTSSNPINVDSPPQSRPLQTNTYIPNVNLPGAIPLINNGWPSTYQNRSAPNDAAGYLRSISQHDYTYGNPSSDEIKELLANIRPDEDIKVEDKDAIIPGFARHMRLMKHQQVCVFCCIANFRWDWRGCKRWRMARTKAGFSLMKWVSAKQFKGISNESAVNFSIALLVSRPSDDDDCRTTLICCPVALLRQWFNEIRTKTDPPLSVYIHHSSTRGKKAKTTSELLKYDVVLTTYSTIVRSSSHTSNFRHSNGKLVTNTKMQKRNYEKSPLIYSLMQTGIGSSSMNLK